jgi:hypothetical protein
MKHVIATLENAIFVVENNEPTNRRERNTAQADYEAEAAAEMRQALAILRAVDAGPIYPQPTPTTTP